MSGFEIATSRPPIWRISFGVAMLERYSHADRPAHDARAGRSGRGWRAIRSIRAGAVRREGDGRTDAPAAPRGGTHDAATCPDLHRGAAPRRRRPTTSWRPTCGEYNAYTEMLQDRGAYEAGEALQPTATATTVRVRDGQTIDHRRAVRRDEGGPRRLLPGRGGRPRRGDRLAARIPGAKHGSIEVRPIFELRGERSDARPAEAAAATDRGTRPRRVRPAAATRSSTACSARSRAGRSRR